MTLAHRLTLLALLVVFAGCAHVKTAPEPSRRDRPQPGKALVIFYREDHVWRSQTGYHVYDAFARIGGLPNGSYFTYQADPGQHFFKAATEVEEMLVANLKPGRTYYVRGGIKAGVVISRPTLEMVPPGEGVPALGGLRRVELKRPLVKKP